MKLLPKALLLAALGAASVYRLTAQVVAPTPTSIEGAISEIALNPAGETIMTVIGVKVLVPASLETDHLISSPSKILTLAQLRSETVLPGRSAPGFRQGTAIITGAWDRAGNRMVADSVFVEPAENILLGEVTALPPDVALGAVAAINGVQVVILPGVGSANPVAELLPRVGLTGLRHEVGIPLSSILPGAQAAAEGYFAAGVFNAFVVDASDGVPVVNSAQVVVTRAQSTERTPNTTRGDEYDVRGGSYSPGGAAQRAALYRVDTILNVKTYTLLGAPAATIADVNPSFRTWRFSGVTPTLRNGQPAVLGTAPRIVVAVIVPANVTPPASATSATLAFTSLVRSEEFEVTVR
jgi:hypothetical protein